MPCSRNPPEPVITAPAVDVANQRHARYDWRRAFYPEVSWIPSGAVRVVQVRCHGENRRGRNLLVLPDDRVVVVGLTTPVRPSTDALVVVLLTRQWCASIGFNGTGWRSAPRRGMVEAVLWGGPQAPR